MVGIIDYGAGNIRSLSNALTHLGIEHTISHDKNVLDTCSHLILPGVGSFRYGMEQLERYGLVEFLKNTKKPLLGICLGMQLMAGQGAEGLPSGSDYMAGLGIIGGTVEELPSPHVGWDTVQELHNDFYFTHHYRVAIPGTFDWMPYFVKHNNVWACQFHPEKSQESGLQFLKDFYAL